MRKEPAGQIQLQAGRCWQGRAGCRSTAAERGVPGPATPRLGWARRLGGAAWLEAQGLHGPLPCTCLITMVDN